MFKTLTEILRQRQLRHFAERSALGITDRKVRDEYSARLLHKAAELRAGGLRLTVDPRFRFRAVEEDLDEGRLEFILRRFDGLEYLDDLRFSPGIERKLMSQYQHEKAGFNFRKIPRRAPVLIQLIDVNIGFGAFAERDLVAGEFLGEYAGTVNRSDAVIDRTYCYEYQVLNLGGEEVLLTIDARAAGNEMRFVNHARSRTIGHSFEFYNGHWHTVFTVNGPVSRGEQVFIDYGEFYWEGHARGPVVLSP